MSHIKNKLQLLISAQEIKQAIVKVAKQINRDYKKRHFVIVMIMKGSICLVADLIRELKISCSLEFVRCSSYGQRGAKAGKLKVWGLQEVNVADKDILIVDDIFDSGATLEFVTQQLKKKKPLSIRSLVLLNKCVQRKTDLSPDYTLFPIENEFVVGYGLDYKELYRGLSGIYILRGES